MTSGCSYAISYANIANDVGKVKRLNHTKIRTVILEYCMPEVEAPYYIKSMSNEPTNSKGGFIMEGDVVEVEALNSSSYSEGYLDGLRQCFAGTLYPICDMLNIYCQGKIISFFILQLHN